MDDTSSIRLHGQTYERLKELQREDESLTDALNRILPDEVGEVTRIDENVVAIPTPREVSQRVNKMAGENVSANDVVATLIEEYETDEGGPTANGD